jgi:hypothetical protein
VKSHICNLAPAKASSMFPLGEAQLDSFQTKTPMCAGGLFGTPLNMVSLHIPAVFCCLQRLSLTLHPGALSWHHLFELIKMRS